MNNISIEESQELMLIFSEAELNKPEIIVNTPRIQTDIASPVAIDAQLFVAGLCSSLPIG